MDCGPLQTGLLPNFLCHAFERLLVPFTHMSMSAAAGFSCGAYLSCCPAFLVVRLLPTTAVSAFLSQQCRVGAQTQSRCAE